MNANEIRVFLRQDGSLRDDPGPPLDTRYETITINTSSETFVFTGGHGAATARKALDYVRLARANHGTPRNKRCHAAIMADKGAVALIVLAKKIES